MRQFSQNGKKRYRNYVAGIPFIVQVTDQKSTLETALGWHRVVDQNGSPLTVRWSARFVRIKVVRGLVINETTRYIFGTK